MLWGCSSGNLKYMGDFDRTGTPYHYMLAGWYVFVVVFLSISIFMSNLVRRLS